MDSSNARAVGPVVQRFPVDLTGSGNTVVLGTDRAIYRIGFNGSNATWNVEHPGFVTDQGQASPQFVQELASVPQAGLYLHNTAVGGGQRDHFLFASADGGGRYGALGRPDAAIRGVDHIAVVGPGKLFPRGAFLAVQNVSLSAYPVGDVLWELATGMDDAVVIDAIASRDGEIVLGVQTAVEGELWTSSDDSLFFAPMNSYDASPWLTVGLASDGNVLGLGSASVVQGDSHWELPAGISALRGSFAADRVAILATDGSTQSLIVATIGDALPTGIPLPEVVLEMDPVFDGDTVWFVTSDAALLRYRDGAFVRFAFEGRDAWWSALMADPRNANEVVIGNRLTGNVFRGELGGVWENLGAGLRNSTARNLAIDQRSARGIWLGSFGLYLHVEGSGWSQRTTGMQTYLQTQSLEFMEMSTLATDPLDPTHLWCGTTEGNGPYESVNGGLSWQRRHDGLGVPGSALGEDGLPDATQVRNFVFSGDRTWMASFRGGVWELQPDNSWEQQNVGLPDVDGSPITVCCFETFEHEVDVRELLLMDDGSLLAATGWGTYLDRNATGMWEPSSDGLLNANIVALAVHPDQPDWVLAAARGSSDLAEWLFLSTDGGRGWRAVDTGKPYAPVLDIAWADPSRLTVVAILDGLGAWSMELQP